MFPLPGGSGALVFLSTPKYPVCCVATGNHPSLLGHLPKRYAQVPAAIGFGPGEHGWAALFKTVDVSFPLGYKDD